MDEVVSKKEKRRRRLRLSYVGGKRPSLLPPRQHGPGGGSVASEERTFTKSPVPAEKIDTNAKRDNQGFALLQTVDFDSIKNDDLPVQTSGCPEADEPKSVNDVLTEDNMAVINETILKYKEEQKNYIALQNKYKKLSSFDIVNLNDLDKSSIMSEIPEDIRNLLDLDVEKESCELRTMMSDAKRIMDKADVLAEHIFKKKQDAMEALEKELMTYSPVKNEEATPRTLIGNLVKKF